MFIAYEEIEKIAEEFLGKYHSSRSVPVPIEKIVEIDLQISVVPISGLLKQESIDAFLSHDFKELYIDHDHYMGQTNRSRFTLAHEIGHLCLHKEIVEQVTSIEQWKKFVLGEGTGESFYEVQADNFAGCLLMPKKELLLEYAIQKDKVEKRFKQMKAIMPDTKTAISYMANGLAKKFDVSPKAAEIRLFRVLKV